MLIVHPCCAGIDVHKRIIVVCCLKLLPDGTQKQEIRSFGATTEELLQLLDWLLSWEVTCVAMESTGEYWKPIHNILEGNLEVWLVNAQHVKNVPGRKTDVKDGLIWAQECCHFKLGGSSGSAGYYSWGQPKSSGIDYCRSGYRYEPLSLGWSFGELGWRSTW